MVPTDWQRDLIPHLPGDKVTELYGKLPADFVGGGRPTPLLPRVSKKAAALHIATAHKYNLKFNYLLNSLCLDNLEFTKSGRREILRLIEWLTRIGVDSVTIATPFMFRLIKKEFPSLKISVSSQANVNNVREAKFWEDLGVDQITLSIFDVSRNFPLLKEIRKAVKCHLQLIANLRCLAGCPLFRYHNLNNNHGSQAQHILKGFVLAYYPRKCQYQRISSPVEYIKSNWIRPEDVHYYEELGIDSLKFVDRLLGTRHIISIVKAYTQGYYNGNLLDLVPFASKVMHDSSFFSYSWRCMRYFFRPFLVNVFRLQKGRKLVFREKIYIDNKKLDGFLDYFIEGKCNFLCEPSCDYCNQFARQAVSIDLEFQDRFKSRARDFFNQLYNGRMFSYFSPGRKG